MGLLKLEFINKAHGILLARANLAAGWRRMKYSYGICEADTIDYVGDRRLRVQIEAYSRRRAPMGVGEEFPELLTCSGDGQNFLYSVSDGRLAMLTTTGLIESGVLRNSRKLGFFEALTMDPDLGCNYQLKLLVVLSQAAPPKPRPTIEWDTLKGFLPGGLPSLGKRR